jgi:hypothetical protein
MAEKKRSHHKKVNGAEKAEKSVSVKPKPKQQDLPGMEDRALKPLENLAEQYADVRDSRMELTRQETQLAADLLAMMKKYEKTEYHHGEVHIWVKVTEEKVKVKIGEVPAKATDFNPEDVKVQVGPDAQEAVEA